MEPGILDQPVTIEQQDEQSEFGDKITWKKVCNTWASIRPSSGAEVFSNEYVAEANYVVQIRYRPNIDAHQRVRFTNRKVEYILMVLYVGRPSIARPADLLLYCRELQ